MTLQQLQQSILQRDIDFIIDLINSGKNPNVIYPGVFSNQYALIYASIHNQLKYVELLVESGANINCVDFDGYTAFHGACSSSDIKLIEYLFNAGSDINSYNNCNETPLHTAALHGNTEAIKFLVENGALLNARSTNINSTVPKTPLCYAGKIDDVSILINAGAELNQYTIEKYDSRLGQAFVDCIKKTRQYNMIRYLSKEYQQQFNPIVVKASKNGIY